MDHISFRVKSEFIVYHERRILMPLLSPKRRAEGREEGRERGGEGGFGPRCNLGVASFCSSSQSNFHNRRVHTRKMYCFLPLTIILGIRASDPNLQLWVEGVRRVHGPW